MLESKRSTGFALSLALHAVLFCLAFFNLSGTLKVDMDKPMYTVDLVSLNPSENPAAGETGEPAGAPDMAEASSESGDEHAAPSAAAIPPPPKAVEKPKPEPRPRDDAKLISEKKVVEDKKKPEKKVEQKPEPKPETKPEPKVDLKKQREDALKEALKDVKQDVAKDRAKDKVKDALKDIRAKEGKGGGKKDAVAGELAALRKSTGGNIFSASGTGPGGAGGGKGRGAGGTGTGLMSVYGDIVKQIIKKNWRYAAMGTETNMAVLVEINIEPSGKITAARVVKSSGNAGFDNSAMSAVAQTQTLPPPRTKSLDTLRITFNLQDLLR